MSNNDEPTKLEPRLRFPEFRQMGEWQVGRCSDIAEVMQGFGFPEKYQGRDSGKFPFVKVGDISIADECNGKYIAKANNYVNDDVISAIGGKVLPAGATLFAKIGEAIRSNRRVMASVECIVDNNVAAVCAVPDKVTDEFLYYLWSTVSLIDFAGGVVPAISKTAIKAVPIAYPSSEAEQRKIAECLGSLDDWIAAETDALAALRRHKTGLMQQLFPRPGETRPRLRFPEFRGKSEWRKRRIGEILVKKAKAVTPDRDTLYREIGVRSHGKGLFHKDAVLGSTLGTKRVFHVVPDALVFNIVFAWERAVAVTTEAERGFIASHRFPMFLPRSNRCDVRFMQRLFLTPIGKELLHIASPGGAGRNRTLSQSDLSNLHAFIPDTDEQRRIADCLVSLDTLLATQAKKLAALHDHKRGLTQQLFPTPDAIEEAG